MTTPTTTHVTFTDLLAVLFPTGIDGYVKLVAEGSQRSTDYWFRRSPEGTWLWQRQYSHKEPPTTMEQFLAANAENVSLSPLGWTAPALGSRPVPPAAVWAALPVATLPPTVTTLTVPRPDVAGAERARQVLAEFSMPPSVVLDEGNRLVGLWLMRTPLTDPAQVDRVLRALASALGGDYVLAGEALVAVPGTRNTRLHPAPTVEIVTWEPGRRHGLDALGLA